LPSTAQGTIEGTGRTIEASDSGANTTEVLHDMLQTSAPIQEGDSGGPLVNSTGQVIGMDTAANASTAAPGSGPSANATGFAIPVNDATAIERQIASGRATTTVHIGLAGFMGISVADASKGCSGQGGISSGSGSAPAHSGAMICEVFPGTPAQSAGLSNGDVITSADGHAITNEAGLTSVTATTHPGDLLKVSYVNSSGTQHTASFALTEWAK
jgi:S1-C subfamily serine protease